MTAAAHERSFREIVVDVVYRGPERPRRVSLLTPEEKADELARIQAERARLAAREADVILGFAADRPDDEDPPAGHPGARSRTWRQTDPPFPGVSESFPQELAMVLGVGRGTAAHKLRRAWTLRHSLPMTETAQRAGALDETAAAQADIFLEPGSDGRATLGAELNADEAAEAHDFIDTVAQAAKKDGDPRPIGQIRNEIYSLLVRGAAVGAHGVRATLTVVAALEALEGTSSRPADANGFAITPAHLADLLRRVGALGLQAPEGGSLTFAITDKDGALLATLSMADLQRQVRRGEGATPPAATDGYTPTADQREFLTTRDRTCRMPFCGQRTGWADHDHVLAHSAGGPTTCTNLCCLCRTCHRLKTLFKGWSFVMEPDGTLHVTTPSGVTRTSRPWNLRRRPPPEPPPADAPPF